MPNLRTLKLVLSVHSSDLLTRIPIGIKFLSELKEVSAKIGGVGPDRSHRKAVELAFREAIRVHARCQRVHVQCVDNIIAHKEGQSSITILDEKDSNEHDEILPEDSGQGENKDADNRSESVIFHLYFLGAFSFCAEVIIEPCHCHQVYNISELLILLLFRNKLHYQYKLLFLKYLHFLIKQEGCPL